MDDATILLPHWAATSLRDTASVSRIDEEFDAFFVQHFDAIVNSLTVITGDRDRATDATQDAFIKAYARWNRVRRHDLPSMWVRRVAINASRDSHRSERRRARREERHLPTPVESPSDEVVGHDTARRLLAGLPRRQREVATLFYIDDLSVASIAETLGLRVGTVKSHLSDARSRLRQVVDEEPNHVR